MLSEHQYRSLIEQLPAITYIAEARVGGRWLFVSPQIDRMLGFSAKEWLSRPDSWINQVYPEDREEIRAKENIFQKLRQPFHAEYRMVTRAGETIWVRDEANFVYDTSGKPIFYQGVILNITDRKTTEEALGRSQSQLLKSEESFKYLFANNPLPMWLYDLETLDFLEVNEAAVKQYGYQKNEFLTMKILDIRPESDHSLLLQEMSKERPQLKMSGYWRHRRKSGEIIEVEITSHTLAFEGHKAALVVAQDVTEKRRVEADKSKLESQLRQVQKMEALGHLAGGVAHDFNNLLMAITGYCELAKIQLPDDTFLQAKIQRIYDVALMGASLTKQLLAFSRRQPLELKILNLNDVLRSMEPILKRLIRQDIELQMLLADDLGSIKADRSQIEQVILNLAVNARDAMPKGGTMSIETGNTELDATYVQNYPDVLPGDYVMMAIVDTGNGMDKDTQLHIFEPFFTTKQAGHGTGLGLATVFGVVKQSAGHITVYSELGKGTVFRIYLPRELQIHPQEIAEERPYQPAVSVRLTVLLADDNEMVRQALAGLLELHNCLVLQAGDGQKALTLLKEENNHIDILITDMVMPKMSGVDLAEKARALHPNLSVLFMSGYSENTLHYTPQPKTAFLTKPAPIQKILQKIRELLGLELV